MLVCMRVRKFNFKSSKSEVCNPSWDNIPFKRFNAWVLGGNSPKSIMMLLSAFSADYGMVAGLGIKTVCKSKLRHLQIVFRLKKPWIFRNSHRGKYFLEGSISRKTNRISFSDSIPLSSRSIHHPPILVPG